MNNFDESLVSVIVLAYNSSKFIIETLDSIKAQTWNNVELIITDDASKDNTVELCKKWIEENSKRFKRTEIITVSHNTGISSNCNRGIRVSNGDWIKMIAGDDALLENCILDNMYYSIQFPESMFILSDVIEIDDDSEIINMQKINGGLLLFNKNLSSKEQLKAYSRWPAFLNSPTFFFKKQLIESIGYFDEEFKIYDDMSAIFRVLKEGIRIHYFNKATVKYRIHNKSISRCDTVDEVREKEALRIFKKYRKQNLSIFNPIDLSVFFESWLRFKYKGFYGYKGISVLQKFSLLYWYLRFNGIRSY